MMRIFTALPRVAAAVCFGAVVLPWSATLRAQAAATTASPAGSAARAVGTVKSINGGTVLVTTDKGDSTTVTLPDGVRVLQLAPGSTDLKTAQPAAVSDIAEGDRVLIAGNPGADSGAITAVRVVLMKSSAIAETNAARQQDWQRRGSGGVVSAVDSSAHTLKLAIGKQQETVTTTSATTFRRYAPGSVKFEEAKVGTIGDIQPGDQVRVRGDKAADGTSIAAEEIVSGAFRNLAGLVTKVDSGANTVTLNDLATKKPVTVAISSESELRALPPEMGARFAARARGGVPGAGPSAGGTARPAYAGAATGAPAREGMPSGGAQVGPGGAYGPGAGRTGGADLSQVVQRLPKSTLTELKPGEAVMVVASGNSTPGSPLTAITLLSGVEPLLAAAPQGSANAFSLSPWSLGSGGEGGEGAGPQ